MSSNVSPSDYNSDSEDSLEPQISRLNRWQGPPSTWRGITRDERGLVATLDTLRNQDLSLHLFNSHSLKRKAREFEAAKIAGQEISKLQDTRRFVPSKLWAAWPLLPDDVPRAGEEIGKEDELAMFTLKKREKVWPSRELEEVLTAVALKQAKEKFLGRQSENEPMDKNSVLDESEVPVLIEEEQQFDNNADESRSQSPTSGQQTAIDRSDSPTSSRAHSEAKSLPDKPVQLIDTIYQPVISMDDDRSSQLLRPSIRHTLSKLDNVLIALHHARDTCLRYSRSDAGTDDEDRAMNITSGENGAKRPVGRPRKLQPVHNDEGRATNLASVASGDGAKRSVGRPRKQQPIRNDTDDAKPSSPTPSQLLRTKKTVRGRPHKDYPRLEGETQQEHLIRIARLQKRPLPSFAPPLEPRRSSSRERTKNPANRYTGPRYTKEELRVRREKKLGVRDWSEVLGAAALAGFEAGVIERAAQRCAAMFGESMSIRTILETPFAEYTDVTTIYQPELIPHFDEERSSDGSSSANESDVEDLDIDQEHAATSKSKVIAGPRCCPLRDCNRHQAPFRDNYSLQRHLKKVHKITEPDDTPGMEEFNIQIPSDEEMDGGVHVDGFLRPLKPSFIVPSKSQKNRKASTRGLKNRIKIAARQSGESAGGESNGEKEIESGMESENLVDGIEIDEVESDNEHSPDLNSSSDDAVSSENE